MSERDGESGRVRKERVKKSDRERVREDLLKRDQLVHGVDLVPAGGVSERVRK